MSSCTRLNSPFIEVIAPIQKVKKSKRPGPTTRTADLQKIAKALGVPRVMERRPGKRGMTWGDDADIQGRYTASAWDGGELSEPEEDNSELVYSEEE